MFEALTFNFRALCAGPSLSRGSPEDGRPQICFLCLANTFAQRVLLAVQVIASLERGIR